MNKYIVKNCPSLDTDGITCQDCSFEDCGMEDCSNRNNCLIKQVIDTCKSIECPCEFIGASCWECSTTGEKTLADKILQLFEVKECK